MTTLVEPSSSSPLSVHNESSRSPTQSNSHSFPVAFTTTQLEAVKICAHLLDTLKKVDTDYYERYGRWVEQHPDLVQFCFQCIRPQVWAFLNGRWSLDGLKGIGGDIRFEGRGVYLNGVFGLDRKVRIYVGQSNFIRTRIAQHLNFRYRRDNPSLHYHAMQQSTYNAIGVLAQLPPSNASNSALPGMDRPDLMLNVLEMWMALVFRALPREILEEWLPNDDSIHKRPKYGVEGDFRGLNIASPLDHGGDQRRWLDLSDCDDPLVRDYLGMGKMYNDIEQRKTGYTKHARRYNAKKQQDSNSSQTVGLVIIVTMAVLIGTTLLRSTKWQSR